MRNTGLALVSATDGAAIELFYPGGHPSWSPDGSRIAYEVDNDIWVVAVPPTTSIEQESWGQIKEAYR